MLVMVLRPLAQRQAKASSLARVRAADLQNAGRHKAKIVNKVLSRFIVSSFL